jgi:hypothetical protein
MKQVTEMMNRTTRRTEEERSNTMERKKWWAGLIAVAAGFAFAVGSASAYVQGDFARGSVANANSGKLVPYYMAGDNLATIIGVDNQADMGETDVSIIEVRVLDVMGALQAKGQLCLKNNQFGYAVLKEEMMMDDMDDMDSQVVLMLGVGDDTAKVLGITDKTVTGVSGRAGSSVNTETSGTGIASMGYVVLSDQGTFTTADPQPEDLMKTDDGCDSQGDPAPNIGSKFAAWTILQDVGDGSFFGTEIPTLSVNTSGNVDVDEDRISCNRDAIVDECGGLMPGGNIITARFDNDAENDSKSMIYVWTPTHVKFDEASGKRATREINATVYCEGMDKKTMTLDIPDRVNVVPGSVLGCNARGTVMFKLSIGNTDLDAASVWSHISQVGGGFRMNFGGYHDAIPQ